MKFLLAHQKELAIILYIISAIFYIIAVYEFYKGNNTQGIYAMLFGAAEMCIASPNTASLKKKSKVE